MAMRSRFVNLYLASLAFNEPAIDKDGFLLSKERPVLYLYDAAALYKKLKSLTLLDCTMPIFEIEYPITRTIRRRWIAPVSYTGAFVLVVFLTVLNVALVGYETVNVFENNFNFTQDLWFHHLIPYGNPRPGSLCDPHLIAVGDQFTVQNGFLNWTVHAITNIKDNSTAPSVPYSGGFLDSCEAKAVVVYIDTGKDDVGSAILADLECQQFNGFNLKAWATPSQLLQHTAKEAALSMISMYNQDEPADTRVHVVNNVVAWAFSDVFGYLNRSGHRKAHLRLDVVAACSDLLSSTDCGRVPPYFIKWGQISNEDATQYHEIFDKSLDRRTDADLWNLAQVLYYTASLDIGINSVNNFLAYKEAVPIVLVNSPGSEFYQFMENVTSGVDENNGRFYPLTMPNMSTIQVDYMCRQQRLKTPGSLIISVLVAVLSMFSGAWTLYLWILSAWAKRDQGANTCVAHPHGLYQSVEAIDSDLQSEKVRARKVTSA